MKRNEKQRVTVTIYGQNYTVIGKESPTHVKEIAQFVDEKMKEIKKRNIHLDTTKLAVLMAMNIVDDYMKLLKENEDLTKELEQIRAAGDEENA